MVSIWVLYFTHHTTYFALMIVDCEISLNKSFAYWSPQFFCTNQQASFYIVPFFSFSSNHCVCMYRSICLVKIWPMTLHLFDLLNVYIILHYLNYLDRIHTIKAIEQIAGTSATIYLRFIRWQKWPGFCASSK